MGLLLFMSAPGVAPHDGAGGHRCGCEEGIVFARHPHAAAFGYALVDVGGGPGNQEPGGDDEAYDARPASYRAVPAYGTHCQHHGGEHPHEENMVSGD